MSILNKASIEGLVIAAVGAFCLFHAIKIAQPNDNIVSPRQVPLLVSSSIFVLGLVSIVRSLLNRKHSETADKVFRPATLNVEDFTRPQQFSPKNFVRITLIVVVGFLYTLLLPLMGYVVSTFLALATMLTIFGNNSPIKVMSISILGSLAYFVFFVKLLGVSVPAGSLVNLSSLGMN